MQWTSPNLVSKCRRACGHARLPTRVATVAVLLVSLATQSARAAPGELDPSFGQGGYAAWQVNQACLRMCVELAGSEADALALQPDGGIVLGGENEYIGAPGDYQEVPGALVRLEPNGALDTSFGVAGGIDDTPFAVSDVYADASGGLLAIGGLEGGRTGVQRYTAGGVLDGSFGSGGVQWLPRLEGRQRDAVGRFVAVVTVPVPATDYDPSTTRLDVTRLLPSGRPDAGFGHLGYARLPDTQGAAPVTLATQPGGSVVAAFRTNGQLRSTPSRLLLERLTPTGKLDRAFGKGGVARVPFHGMGAGRMAVAPNGHILLAVGEQRGGPTLGGEEELVLADYTRAGRLDRSFGDGGVARSQLPSDPRYVGVAPNAIAFDASGDAIVVGEHRVRTVDTPAGEGFLARYTPHGRDCSFGSSGVVVDERFDGINAAAVQPDGRIVVAGGRPFLAARYVGGGTPTTCPGEPAHRG